MQTVLYSDDMEPITVLELGPFMQGCLERHGYVRVAVPEPPRYMAVAPDDEVPPLRVVEIRGEAFVRHGKRHILLFTYQDENALLLQSAFLPGQTQQINETKAKAFGRGFLAAVRALG